MPKQSVRDIDPSGKRAVVRVDFNVPMDGGSVADDTRIRSSIPTIEYLLNRGAAVILMSHLGRPKGSRRPEWSLSPVGRHLSKLLGREVLQASDCIGDDVEAEANSLEAGQILLLENLRFHPEEEQNDPHFARRLAGLGDLFVNDAFGAAHRAHASTEGIAHLAQVAVSGLLMEREVTYLSETLRSATRPFLAILGGAKVSGKVEVIEFLCDKVDALLIGGGMQYTFYEAMGLGIGQSLREPDCTPIARDLISRCEDQQVELILPTDCVVAERFDEGAQTKIVGREEIPDDWQGLDIGPETRKLFSTRIGDAKTIIWNGPLGVFEMKLFSEGTRQVAEAIALATEAGAISIIGGGDTAAAVVRFGYAENMTHISTGGGASLEAMAGRELPGVAALSEL